MKCVKCSGELPEGSKFCKYCGEPQPAPAPAPAAQPQTVFCKQCGKELPASSKFCKYCGTAAGTAPASAQQPIPAPQPVPVPQPVSQPINTYQQPEKPKKKTGLIIGCIIAAIVLVIAVLVLLWVLNRDNEDSFFAFGKNAESEAEEQGSREEEESKAEEEDSSRDSEEVVTPEEPEMSEAEASYNKALESGISGEVDYSVISYEANEMDIYQSYDSTRVAHLLDGEIFDDLMLSGTLYSQSEGQDMEVEVYYDPETYAVDRIVTVQPEEDHLRIYDMYFDEGQLRLVRDYTAYDYDSDPNYDTSYGKQYILAYTEDRLVELLIDRGEEGTVESYLCQDFDSMDDGVQSLFVVREASYLNRAYMTLEAVTR